MGMNSVQATILPITEDSLVALLLKISGNVAISGAGIAFLRAQIANLEHRCTVLRARSAILLPKKPTGKEPAIKLRDLPPKNDSFHVILPDKKELIFRLYFVDTPEEERAYADRIAEQAAYFGISLDAAIQAGDE